MVDGKGLEAPSACAAGGEQLGGVGRHAVLREGEDGAAKGVDCVSQGELWDEGGRSAVG